MYEFELESALATVAEVCELTARVQGEIAANADAHTKSDRSPVTIADLAAQILVGKRLAEAFPGDALLAEEDSTSMADAPEMTARVLDQVGRHVSGITENDLAAELDRGGHEGGRGRYWVLDPIDGTKGFLRGEQYAVALALVDDGRVVVGVLGCPNLAAVNGNGKGALFSAVKGMGANQHPLDGGDARRARVDGIDDPRRAVICESVVAAHAAHSVQGAIAERLGIAASPYRIDSQCKYAVVARGEASIYLRLPRDRSYREKVWDHAAGALVVEEAGGRVSDLDGHELDFSKGRFLAHGNGIVCTNGTIHEHVLEACRAELGV